MIKYIAAAAGVFILAACGETEGPTPDRSASPSEPQATQTENPAEVDAETALDVALNDAAERFVKLALAIGRHDKNFVDAYHGPAAWQADAGAELIPLENLEAEAEALVVMLDDIPADEKSVRSRMLRKLARAAHTRIRMTQGVEFTFDEETRLLYDAVAPQYETDQFHAALDEINALVPGDAPLHERVEEFRNSLAIPQDKLQTVFDAAIAECRERTLAQYELPDGESFDLSFVTDKPWSGYNWYQGGFNSLIEVNTDFPIIIDRAVDLGCHEGYPGHHTWNVLLEQNLLKDKGWIEYSVYPLFSPLSVTAEGSANFGIELAFPGDEKIAFERDVLFPLAGLDSEKAETLAALNTARRKLSHARNHIARLYLDGAIDRGEAVRMLMEFGLQSEQRAEQGVDFIDTYRGYVINYNIGRDIVEGYISRRSAAGEGQWDAFETLLTTPLAASDIKAAE